MLRQDLQSYFDSVYPFSKVEAEESLGGQIHIRFELGGELKNGTKKRVNEATNRALILFYDVFPDPDTEIFVLIHEYQGRNCFNASNDYLYKQFPEDSLSKFYNSDKDENGNNVLEECAVRIVIGKLPVKNIVAKNILNAIANTEMGFSPAINQRIFFFDPFADKAFQMYDDRGCCIWSDKADKIRDIYLRRNDWIVDYHRREIEEYFK